MVDVTCQLRNLINQVILQIEPGLDHSVSHSDKGLNSVQTG